jgi:hypothetical protein
MSLIRCLQGLKTNFKTYCYTYILTDIPTYILGEEEK